jgi:nitrilase
MRVSVMQMSPQHDKAANIEQASQLASAADLGDFLSLPEMWSCLGGDRATKFAQAETLPPPGSGGVGGEAYEFLRGLARSRGIVVHGGSIAERGVGDEAGRLFNTTLVFDRNGQELARYRKIHLFDIVTPDGKGYRESATYGSGSDVVTYQAAGLTVGASICYDMRFAELYRELRQRGAELIFAPAAFTVPTGQAHWHVLLRARAIETQCYVAAAATVGDHIDAAGKPRATYGHSLIVDPWGQVVAEVPDGIGVVTAEIDLQASARIRRDMPVLEHRVARHVLALDGAVQR